MLPFSRMGRLIGPNLQGIHYSIILPNGLTLVAEPISSVRSAAFHLILPGGAATDPEGLEGSATVLEGYCYRGANGRDARALTDALEDLGAHRSGGAELEAISFGCALLADDLYRALELYADIVRRPDLPPDELEAERSLALQRLARLDDSPAERLFVNLRRAYYRGPYGRTSLGAEEGLKAISAGSVRRDHENRFRPSGAVLGIAGRFEWKQLCDEVHRLFGDWEGEPPPLPDAEAATGKQYLHVPAETNQEHIGVMYRGVGPKDPHYYAMRMAIEVLSGGMGARLFTEVREKRGLCYSVRAMPFNVRSDAAIMAYAGTTAERCDETLSVLLAELRRLKAGVTEEELSRARIGVLSALVMQSEATAARARHLTRDQFALGRVRTMSEIRNRVEAVTTEEIAGYAAEYPAADLTVVTLGPRSLAEEMEAQG